MPAVIFTDEKDGQRVALEFFGDLPAGLLTLGASTKTTVTDYGGRNARSVQVLGDEHEPINLSGRWSGRQTGDPQRPRQLVQLFEALRAKAALLRFEWGPYQRWGILGFKSSHKTDDEVEFEISFMVLYDKPPESLTVAPYQLAPGDQSLGLTQAGDRVAGLVSTPPIWALGSYVLSLNNAVAGFQNKIAEGVGILSGITSYAEISSDRLRQATGALGLALGGASTLLQRTLNATEDTAATLGSTPAQALSVIRWTELVELETRRMRVNVVELLRALVAAQRPAAARRHIVRDRETLYTIATLYFGDMSAWAAIADANGLLLPIVAPGTLLLIPDEVRLT